MQEYFFIKVIIMQLTQKETELLKDLKTQEQLCAEKYERSAKAAHDRQLSELFTELAQVERNHYNMLCSVEQGNVPQINEQQGGAQQKSFTAAYGVADTPDKQEDAFLCNDLLAAEKHASGLYDTSIFEFSQGDARNLLNHIQKEEQHHGKYIYDYMSANSIY